MNNPENSLLEVALPSGSDQPGLELPQIASGQQLAQTRAAAGLTVEALADRLKLSTNQVLALDTERWDQLPDSAFVRAALRAYGRQVGGDVTALIAHVGGFGQATVLKPIEGDHKSSKSFATSRISRSSRPQRLGTTRLASWPVMLGSVAGVASLGLVIMILAQIGGVSAGRSVQSVQIPGIGSGMGQTSPASIEAQTAGQSVVRMTQVDALPVTIRDSGSMMKVAIDRSVSVPSTTAGIRVKQSVASVLPAVNRTAFPVQMPDSEPVHVHFNKRSWIDIRHKDGIKLLSGTKDGSQSMKIDGTPPMQVKVGNPAGVTIEFRGQIVDLKSKINNKGIAQFTLN